MNAQLQPTGSAYFIAKETEKPENHTLSVLVDNEPGVLARVIVFSGRATTSSLTVSRPSMKHLSRMPSWRAAPHVLEQIKHQLERIVPVHVSSSRRAVTNSDRSARWAELALVKVAGTGEARVRRRLADAFISSVIDANTEHFIFEITGKGSARPVHRHHEAARPGRICRTSVAAMNRPAGCNGGRCICP
jgi:acetolactate synthase-1/3 small subunit